MTKYREIQRLHSQGISQRSIASSCQCSRNTVATVFRRAAQHELSWPVPKDTTDADLQNLLFPEKNISSNRRIPNCEHVHKEISKSGVTLSLLWNEYCEDCRLNNEIPLMYSQFCRYYSKYANTTKSTMHIKRKPGEMLEVDWAGQNTSIVVSNLLSSHRVQQQGFKSCVALIKLADKYSVTHLEAACEKALSYTPSPSLKSIQMILKTKHDKVSKEEPTTAVNSNDSAKFGFTRGADYYGGNQNN